VRAFLIDGVLGTYIGWRPAFGILIALSAIVFILSIRLKPDRGCPEVQIDVVGIVLAAAAIVLISFGFNNLNRWGLGLATANVPSDLLGLSPEPGASLSNIVKHLCGSDKFDWPVSVNRFIVLLSNVM
jgi:hypothetical protein